MKNHLRIAIADRSVLAHNVYKMLLKPLGFSLFPYRTLHDLKENLNSRWGCRVFLINSNAFGNQPERYLDWLQSDSIKNADKIFLCEPGEKKIQSLLKNLPHSRFMSKPFYPNALEKTVKGFFKGVL